MGYWLEKNAHHNTEVDLLLIALNERYFRGEIDIDELRAEFWECAQIEKSIYQNQDIALSGVSSRRDDDLRDQDCMNSSQDEVIVIDTRESCSKVLGLQQK